MYRTNHFRCRFIEGGFLIYRIMKYIKENLEPILIGALITVMIIYTLNLIDNIIIKTILIFNK